MLVSGCVGAQFLREGLHGRYCGVLVRVNVRVGGWTCRAFRSKSRDVEPSFLALSTFACWALKHVVSRLCKLICGT